MDPEGDVPRSQLGHRHEFAHEDEAVRVATAFDVTESVGDPITEDRLHLRSIPPSLFCEPLSLERLAGLVVPS